MTKRPKMQLEQERSNFTVAFAGTLGLAAVLLVGCRSDMAAVQQAPIVDGNAASDPANVNMAAPLVAGSAPGGFDAARAARNGYAPQPARVAGESYSAQPQSSAETYPAPQGRQTRNEAYNYNTEPVQSQANGYGDDDRLYGELLDPNVGEVQQPPPPLPTYEQPVAPGPDYLWTPGYWDYQNTGYYYVPGNWVAAPFVGALWTPGWWGYTGRGYGWHRGYWGRHVGYYGGVNYGFGFLGTGYQGGYWNDDHFQYNRAVNHVDPRTVNNYVYQRNVSVTSNTYVNNTRVSYYGGPGGLERHPLPAEFAAAREAHMAPLAGQVAERQAAAQNRQQFFSANAGRPQQVFASRPLAAQPGAVPSALARPQGGFGSAQGGAQGNGFDRAQPRTGTPQQQANVQRQQLEQPQRVEQQAVHQQQVQRQQQVIQQQRQAQQQQNQQRQQAMQQGNLQRLQQQQQQVRQQQNVQRAQQQQNQQRAEQQQARQQQLQQQQVQQQNRQQFAREQEDQQRVTQQAIQQRAQQRAVQQQQVQEQQRAVQQQQQVQQHAAQQQAQQRVAQQQQSVPHQHSVQPQQHSAPQPAHPQAAPHAEGGHDHGH